MRKVSLGFAALAAGLLALAAYQYAADREPNGPALTVEAPEVDLGQVHCKVPTTVRFRFKNASRQPIEVFGLEPG